MILFLQNNIPDSSRTDKSITSLFNLFENPDYKNIILGVLTSIIGGFVLYLVAELYNFLISKKFTLTGNWEQQIVLNGNVTKKDLISITQRGVKVIAKSERIFPENQKSKKWHFSGRFQNDHLYGFYYSNKNLSCGTINLILSNENLLLGFYHKTSNDVPNLDEGELNLVKKVAQKFEIKWIKLEKK